MRMGVLLACLLLPGPLMAEPLGLAEVVDLALAHAPAEQAAEAGRDAAAEDAAIGRAPLLPRVELTGVVQKRRQTTRYDKPQNFFKTDLNYTETTVGLKLVQSLFDLERWAGYRQGQLSAEAGELKLQLERQRLILEAARVGLDVATAQASLTAAEAREQAAAKLAVQAEAAYRVGTAPRTDQLEAEARRDLATADRLRAANDLDQARATLASLTGRPIDSVALPQLAEQPAGPKPADPKAWESRADEQAVAVKLAHVQFDSAKQAERRALGGALPKVEAFAEYNRDRSGDTMLNSAATVRDRAVGVQLSMPLYAGGGTTAAMRKSEKQALQAGFSLEDDRRLARLSARQACLALQAAAAQLTAMRQATLSAEQAARAAHLGHQVGLRTITEVLDADERQFAAEEQLAAARSQYIFAGLQLAASVGALSGRELPGVLGGAS